jgi:carboxypeptidase C (cathepsin A)
MLDSQAGRPPRPLLFVWNGGPGSSTAQQQLLGLGPRMVKMGDDFGTSGPFSTKELVDNQETWLQVADLVFMDPGTAGSP